MLSIPCEKCTLTSSVWWHGQSLAELAHEHPSDRACGVGSTPASKWLSISLIMSPREPPSFTIGGATTFPSMKLNGSGSEAAEELRDLYIAVPDSTFSPIETSPVQSRGARRLLVSLSVKCPLETLGGNPLELYPRKQITSHHQQSRG